MYNTAIALERVEALEKLVEVLHEMAKETIDTREVFMDRVARAKTLAESFQQELDQYLAWIIKNEEFLPILVSMFRINSALHCISFHLHQAEDRLERIENKSSFDSMIGAPSKKEVLFN